MAAILSQRRGGTLQVMYVFCCDRKFSEVKVAFTHIEKVIPLVLSLKVRFCRNVMV
jgi:hypothetical protein